MVTSIPTSTTLTIEMESNESGSGASTSGGIRVQHYYPVGPAVEVASTGWGLGSWGGQQTGQFTSTLSSGINSSATSLTMASSSSFASSGTVQIGTELITYTGVSGVVTGPSASTGQAGSGATFQALVLANGVCEFDIITRGSDYVVGDTINILDSSLGGGGAPDITITVTATG